MNYKSISRYLRHYGSIRSLRGSVIRSTFQRVVAEFDSFDDATVRDAISKLGQNPDGPLVCVYCGDPATCWDHLTPAARGGTHHLQNFAPCCGPCNTAKGRMTWQEYVDGMPVPREEVREKLANHTSGYHTAAALVTADEQRKLDAILEQIFTLMVQADQIVKAARDRREQVS